MATSRPKRANAGAKMASLLNSMEEDEFYKTTYGGFHEEAEDKDFEETKEAEEAEVSGKRTDLLRPPLWFLMWQAGAEEDDADSDFSLDENEEPKASEKKSEAAPSSGM